MPDVIDRVTILAVGVWQYEYLKRLTGPEMDLRNMRAILVEDPDIAVFTRRQYLELVNPTADQFRRTITQYIIDRGTDNDILLLYFSGHGAPIGANDFGFCTIDTNNLQDGSILPMTAVSFSEILKSLWLRKIYPVFILDACYSGSAGAALTISSAQLIDELKGEVQRKYASSYALFCSAPNDQEVKDNPDGNGGLISTNILKIAQEGISPDDVRSIRITLANLFPTLRQNTERNNYGSMPVMLLGQTLPDFSMFNNPNFRPLEYRLQPHLVAVLRVLWNNGKTVELRPGQISDATGLKGAYGNHNKLSFEPWDLVETHENRRRLNNRGVAFMQGKLQVPRDIVKDHERNIYVAKANSEMVDITYFDE